MGRGTAIKIGSQKKKSQNLKLLALEKKLKDIENSQTENMQIFQDSQQQKILIQKDIDEIRTIKTQGAMIRTKSSWIEFGRITLC